MQPIGTCSARSLQSEPSLQEAGGYPQSAGPTPSDSSRGQVPVPSFESEIFSRSSWVTFVLPAVQTLFSAQVQHGFLPRMGLGRQPSRVPSVSRLFKDAARRVRDLEYFVPADSACPSGQLRLRGTLLHQPARPQVCQYPHKYNRTARHSAANGGQHQLCNCAAPT